MTKKAISFLLGVVLSIICVITPYQSTYAFPGNYYWFPSQTLVRIRHPASGLYLGIDREGTGQDGARLQLQEYEERNQNQMFILEPVSKDKNGRYQYHIRVHGEDDKIIEIRNASHDDWAEAAQWSTHKNNCAKWQFFIEKRQSKYKKVTCCIKNVESGKLLNVAGNNWYDGNNLIQYHEDNSSAEVFEIINVESKKAASLHGMVLIGSEIPRMGCTNDMKLMNDRLSNNSLSKYYNNGVSCYKYDNETNAITSSQIDEYIKSTYQGTTKNDISFFYYSGHSVWFDDVKRSPGIALYSKKNSQRFYAWNALADILAKNIKGQIVVILDTCYSANFYTNGVQKLENKSDRERFHVITSCGENEKSRPNRVLTTNKYGRFTYSLGEGIGYSNGTLKADKNNDSKITFNELTSYLQQNMNTWGQNISFYSASPDMVLFQY